MSQPNRFVTTPNDPMMPIILRESRAKLVFLVILMGAFVALGIWLMQGADFWLGLGAVVFCGAIGVVLVRQLKSNRSRSLQIDSTGLTYYSLTGSAHVPWKDIEAFGITRIKTASATTRFISWKYSPQAIRPPGRVLMDMSILGFDAGCPAIGLPAEEVIKLLNEFRDQYSRSGPETSAA